MSGGSLAALYAALSPWALAGVVGVSGALSLAHYRALPQVRRGAAGPQAPAGDEWPRVSVVVPARNEEQNLPTLLRSLLALDYPDLDVIVVDDASTDATGALAASYAAQSGGRLRVLHGSGPLPGWTGKNYACYQGARLASGAWLLFTDADTEHAPDSLRLAVATALARGVRALSLFPRQRCESFWERLLLPFAYQQYFTGVRPRALLASTGPALANGQYFLIERAAYWAVDGHAAVAASIIDDVALAGVLKRSGAPPLPCRGEDLLSIRMYRGLASLAEGFTKNAFQFLQEQRASGALVALATACAASSLPALVTALLAGNAWGATGATVAYILQVVALAPWARAFGVPRRYALLAPLAALAFTGVALSSALHALTRRPVRWKGRGYPALASGPSSASPAPATPTRGAHRPEHADEA